MPEFLTYTDLSAVMGIPTETLRHWRQTGYGPKSAKVGRRVLYRRHDVEQWLDDIFA